MCIQVGMATFCLQEFLFLKEKCLWGARAPPFRTYSDRFFIPGSILSIDTGLKPYILPLWDSASVLNSRPPCLNQTLLCKQSKRPSRQGHDSVFRMSPLHPGIQQKVSHLLAYQGSGHSLYSGETKFKLGSVGDIMGNRWTLELVTLEKCAQCSKKWRKVPWSCTDDPRDSCVLALVPVSHSYCRILWRLS